MLKTKIKQNKVNIINKVEQTDYAKLFVLQIEILNSLPFLWSIYNHPLWKQNYQTISRNHYSYEMIKKKFNQMTHLNAKW